MLKSFIFFAKQTLTLSLKRVSFLNSESNSSVIYDVTKVKKKISIDIPFMESKEGEKRLIEENWIRFLSSIENVHSLKGSSEAAARRCS